MERSHSGACSAAVARRDGRSASACPRGQRSTSSSMAGKTTAVSLLESASRWPAYMPRQSARRGSRCIGRGGTHAVQAQQAPKREQGSACRQQGRPLPHQQYDQRMARVDGEQRRAEQGRPCGLPLVEWPAAGHQGKGRQDAAKHHRRQEAGRDVQPQVGQPEPAGRRARAGVVGGKGKHGQRAKLLLSEAVAGRRAGEEGPDDPRRTDEEIGRDGRQVVVHERVVDRARVGDGGQSRQYDPLSYGLRIHGRVVFLYHGSRIGIFTTESAESAEPEE